MWVGRSSQWLGLGITVVLAGCTADEYGWTHPDEARSSGGVESGDGSETSSGGHGASGMHGGGGTGGGGRRAQPEAGQPEASTARPSSNDAGGSPRDGGHSNDAGRSSRDAGRSTYDAGGLSHDGGTDADARVSPEPVDASGDAPDLTGRLGIDVRSTSLIGSDAESLGAGAAFAAFRDVIAAHGYALVPLSSFTTQSLLGVDAVILGMPTSQLPGGEFSPAEIADLGSFVRAGHGVFLSADGGSSRSVTNVNALAAQWGVTFSDVPGVSAEGEVFTGLPVHPLTQGVASFAVDYYQPIAQIAPPASVVVPQVLAAVSGANGTGNVVIMADQSMWMLPPADAGLDSADNRRLLANILRFIAPL